MIRPLALALALSAGTAFAADVHEHGAARLTLVQDRNELTLMLDLPLDSLVGFEHAPRDAKQKAALEAAHEQLEQLATLVSLPAAAGCKVTAVEVEMAHHEGEHDHDHDHDKKHKDEHEDEHKHDDHAHEKHAHDDKHDEHKDEHADAAAQLDYRCDKPEALDTLTLGLFKAFPRIERIDAEAATDRGQGKQVLRAGQAVWTLPAR